MESSESTDSPKNSAIAFQPLRSSEKLDALALALSKAQGAMKHPGKNKTAKVPLKSGGGYEYNYADLADCIDALRGPFAANELALVQIAFNEAADVVGIVTRILHSSGQWIEGTLYITCADTRPQSIGSAITYGRRYSLSPMAGIASDDDDDGSAAQGVEANTSPRERLKDEGSATQGAEATNRVTYDDKIRSHVEALEKILKNKLPSNPALWPQIRKGMQGKNFHQLDAVIRSIGTGAQP